MKNTLFVVLFLSFTFPSPVFAEDEEPNGFQKIGQDIKQVGKTIKTETKKLGKTVGTETKKAANQLADDTKDAREEIKTSGKSFGRSVGDFLGDLGTSIKNKWNEWTED